MFKFDFFKENNTSDDTDRNSSDHAWYIAKEIVPDVFLTEDILKLNKIKTFCCGNFEIKHVSVDTKLVLPEHLTDDCIIKAESNHSDLLTAVYEGGLKIWECTIDLANYIVEHKIDFTNKKVLDLGCGAGLIGILSSLNGAETYFQDYNEEVIKYLTIPNVHLNKNTENFGYSIFYCGDWSSFLELIKEYKFDYIFTSETIYNSSNYYKLYMLFKECLKPNGVVYAAAKTHYFGVGGGIRSFEEFLKQQGLFEISTCWKCSDGLQREILKIIFK
ncbi:hypothetical protein RN001_012493 [Aquatica leii]|uniref:protein-histidine N-methyltransferase n=1 Tax=Aquatica leii TaxID=1421715 RepID=A0AAN7P6A0_9COLE|nr:hypothetical protein RN001_012493 [Aquatica leii]